MTREIIRTMKKDFHVGSSLCASEEQRSRGKEAALSLLARSVQFRHGRLAIIRLHAAVAANAAVPEEHWNYCHSAYLTSKDPAVRALFLDSVQTAGVPNASASQGSAKA